MSTLLFAIYFAVGLLVVVVAVTLMNQGTKLARKFAPVPLLAGLVILLYSTDIVSDNLDVLNVTYSLHFAGIDWMLLFLLSFMIYYFGINPKGFQILRDTLVTLVVLDTVSLLSNPWIHFALAFNSVPLSDFNLLVYDAYVPFEIHLFLSYLLVALVVVVVIVDLVHTPRVYRSRSYVFLTSFLGIVALNGVFLYFKDLLVIDISVLFYCPLILMFRWTIFRYSVRGILSSFRGQILDHIGAPLVIIGYKGQVLDFNEDMTRVVPAIHRFKAGEYARSEELPFLAEQSEERLVDGASWEYETVINGVMHTYNAESTAMYDEGKQVATLVVLHDVSAQRDTVTHFYNFDTFSKHSEMGKLDTYADGVAVVFNIDGISTFNAKNGRKAGDKLFKETARVLRAVFPSGSYYARLDDGDILVLAPHVSQEEARELAVSAQQYLSSEARYHVPTTFGMACMSDEREVVETAFEAREACSTRKLLSEGSSKYALVHSLKQSLIENDHETEEHTKRTANHAVAIGRKLGLSDAESAKIALVAELHDIGKVAIPHDILVKPGSLTDEEREIMKTHSERGYRIARASDELEGIALDILCHHERWDGLGYPMGLAGVAIPLAARIVAIVDSFDVLTHDRPYHAGVSREEAMSELRRCAGTQFDPQIVDVFIECLEAEAAEA